MKHLFILALAASLMTTGCGGGGSTAGAFLSVASTRGAGTSSNSVASNAGGSGGIEGCATNCLSADQIAYESIVLEGLGGGGFSYRYALPRVGMPSNAVGHYFYAWKTVLLSSPGADGLLPTRLTIERASPQLTSLGLVDDQPYTFVRGGKFFGNAVGMNVDRIIRYVGTGIQTDMLARDGSTVLWSFRFDNVSLLPLVGSIRTTLSSPEFSFMQGNGADVFLASNAALTRSGAVWLPDSKIMRFLPSMTTDRMQVVHCTNLQPVPYPYQPEACASGVALAEWVTNRYSATAAQSIFASPDGLAIWLSNSAPGTAGTAYFELNGSIYRGYYEPKGMVINWPEDTWKINKAAWDSIRAAITF